MFYILLIKITIIKWVLGRFTELFYGLKEVIEVKGFCKPSVFLYMLTTQWWNLRYCSKLPRKRPLPFNSQGHFQKPNQTIPQTDSLCLVPNLVIGIYIFKMRTS
jgi:hypothetical protein